jgi:adenosylcobinamide-GDP ribazoletransferase
MNVIKSILIAFSIYSRIPVPTFDWEDKDYRHAICFLPLVGAVIGALVAGIVLLDGTVAGSGPAPTLVLAVLLALIPLFITGGFHLDGYMDVMDAKSSFSGKERSLEIMKDPHIGAFAVIGLLKLSLLWLGALYMVVYDWKSGQNADGIYCYGISFAVVRALCGLWCLYLPKAKTEGMLVKEAGSAELSDKLILFAQIMAAAALWAYVNALAAACCGAGLILFGFLYFRMCKKRFGGVTGDTAGYYVAVGETVVLVILAALAAV